MKAVEIFDACHARYRGLRDWLQDSSNSVRALGLDMPSSGYQWRPDRTRACEYIADFERIGRRTLRRPEWKGRLRLFNAYFVRGVQYKDAIRVVGVSEGTFDYWFGEVKRILGAEYSRTGLFPPGRYFRSRGSAATDRLVSGVPSTRASQEVPYQRNSQGKWDVQQIL